MIRINRHDEILNAAAKVFSRKSFAASTIQDVADEVGLLKGSLYYHIKSKEQILVDIIYDAVQLKRKNLDLIVENEDYTHRQKFHRAVKSYMLAFEQKFYAMRVLVNELERVPQPHKDIILDQLRDYDSIWINLIIEGQKDSVFRKDIDPKIVYYSIMGICNWTPNWYKEDGRFSLAKIAEIYVGIFLKGILSADNRPFAHSDVLSFIDIQ